MTAEDYVEHTGCVFLPLHNTGGYPQIIGTNQDQALGNENILKNQELLRRCTTKDGAIKTHIFTAVQTVFLFPLMDQLVGFGQMTALQMIKNPFNSYGMIDKIDVMENAVKIMGLYGPVEPLA